MQMLIEIAIILVAALMTVWPGIYLVAGILRLARSSRSIESDTGKTPEPANRWFFGRARRETENETEPELLRGGAWIGALERLGVTICIIFGQYAAVAVIVAVKGLGRFSELKTSAASEKFVIGTLASLLWAGFIGLLALWALGAVQ